MEILTVTAKRSGRGFVTEAQNLTKALESSATENVKVIDAVIGRKGFLEYLKTLPKQETIKITPYQGPFEFEMRNEIKAQDGKGIKLKASRQTARIKREAWIKARAAIEDIALIRFNLNADKLDIDAAELRQAVMLALQAAKTSYNDCHKQVYFSPTTNGTAVVGTDGFRMVVTPINGDVGLRPFGISLGDAESLAKALSKADKTGIDVGYKTVKFMTESKILLFRTLDSAPVPYEMVMKDAESVTTRTTYVDSAELKKALKPLAKAKKAYRIARIHLEKSNEHMPGKIVIRAKDDDGGELKIESAAEVIDSGKFGINPRYFIEALESIKKGKIKLSYGEPHHVIRLQGNSISYYIMPMYTEFK